LVSVHFSAPENEPTPIIPYTVSTRRQRHTKLLTNPHRSELDKLSVSRNRRPPPRCGILPNGVIAPFTDVATTMSNQVLQEIAAFHEARIWGTSSTRDAAVSKR
jgi:hypothetical protein